MQVNLKALTREELEAFVRELGWPRYRGRQLFSWIYRKRVDDFDAMSDLSKEDRVRLRDVAGISRIQSLAVQRSALDGTEKYLFALEDGNRIESVLIPDVGGKEEGSRLTLCLSTQAGCTLDCRFCLTGQERLKRNLKAHEIVDQVLAVQDALGPKRRLTHLVMMGMGEPLANLSQLFDALRRLTDPEGVGFSPRRITVSTAGLVPQIKTLGEFSLKVNLSVSLNATTDAVRDDLMPINRLYPIKELLASCRSYPLPRRRRITFEYVLLAGINDSREDARRLIRLVQGIPSKVNLIPFNPFPGTPFERPADAQVAAFQRILLDARLTATVRKSKGRDILAACGQLTGIVLPAGVAQPVGPTSTHPSPLP